jgi:hypothetical protein
MKAQLIAVIGLTIGLSTQTAAAQDGFLTAKKVACTPDRMIQCSAANKCATKAATDTDKAEKLVLDFAARKSAVRKNGKEEGFATIVDEKVAGNLRQFSLQSGENKDERMAATLSADGKLTLMVGGNASRAEATCVKEM